MREWQLSLFAIQIHFFLSSQTLVKRDSLDPLIPDRCRTPLTRDKDVCVGAHRSACIEALLPRTPAAQNAFLLRPLGSGDRGPVEHVLNVLRTKKAKA